ncbi:MAG: sensor histidine kinase, partial [Pirellulaceae bacterium]
MKWPILLAVAMIILLLGLAVGWVLLNVTNAMGNPSSPGLYWVLLSAGSAMFICVVAGVVLYLIWSIQQINLNRRQSNFIDSVTHELKSPI